MEVLEVHVITISLNFSICTLLHVLRPLIYSYNTFGFVGMDHRCSEDSDEFWCIWRQVEEVAVNSISAGIKVRCS